ncbi:hypothetical protein TGRUB_278815B [Toxoplasma gondii RUB]|uniref:Uncharacterized protein n=1 Tax=Toxoplasma gondii RUB TaxID=935652 RepID=A0A086LPF9_TOXGO|nr:hypothetical protein TGRUB_278815B [Toxoplasma gondii RUB]
MNENCAQNYTLVDVLVRENRKKPVASSLAEGGKETSPSRLCAEGSSGFFSSPCLAADAPSAALLRLPASKKHVQATCSLSLLVTASQIPFPSRLPGYFHLTPIANVARVVRFQLAPLRSERRSLRQPWNSQDLSLITRTKGSQLTLTPRSTFCLFLKERKWKRGQAERQQRADDREFFFLPETCLAASSFLFESATQDFSSFFRETFRVSETDRRPRDTLRQHLILALGPRTPQFSEIMPLRVLPLPCVSRKQLERDAAASAQSHIDESRMSPGNQRESADN